MLSCLLSLGNSGFFFSGLLENTKVFIILIAVLLALALVAYFIYAKMMNGRYWVEEMDENERENRRTVDGSYSAMEKFAEWYEKNN